MLGHQGPDLISAICFLGPDFQYNRGMARLLPLIWLTAALRLLAADAFDPIRVSIRKQLVETQVPSLALAVARDGRIVWEEGFGWADREKRVAATEHTLYSLASISKPITATGLMVLVEAGKIDLDKTTVKTGERGGYGIGWSSTERPDGYRVVAHAGGMGGVSTSLRLVESEKLAVVVL
ncbi:MAG: beta-lactamase family protein, partial [Acidobacteria bacterium]|nr:beta-lactamase family protein [Acidobacteriota bacterium]